MFPISSFIFLNLYRFQIFDGLHHYHEHCTNFIDSKHKIEFQNKFIRWFKISLEWKENKQTTPHFSKHHNQTFDIDEFMNQLCGWMKHDWRCRFLVHNLTLQRCYFSAACWCTVLNAADMLLLLHRRQVSSILAL